MSKIKKQFLNEIKDIISLINLRSVIINSVVILVLNPYAITSKIARKMYDFELSIPFKMMIRRAINTPIRLMRSKDAMSSLAQL